ncbi:MAG: dihydroneopterin aldolase [Spirosomataceae bacterium]
MNTVSLEGIEFFAYHGTSDEEQKIGNKFSIDVVITTDFLEAAKHDRLRDTVNYEVVYQEVANAMKNPSRFLEHIAYKIVEGIRKAYPEVKTVKVSVSKFNPPVGGVCARSRITMKG